MKLKKLVALMASFAMVMSVAACQVLIIVY